MREWQSQAHVRHYCKYHVVFVPKYSKKSIYGALRKDIGGILRELCRQHQVELIEGYAMKDHIHSVPRSGWHKEGKATCCIEDEGRPLGLGFQESGSNHF